MAGFAYNQLTLRGLFIFALSLVRAWCEWRVVCCACISITALPCACNSSMHCHAHASMYCSMHVLLLRSISLYTHCSVYALLCTSIALCMHCSAHALLFACLPCGMHLTAHAPPCACILLRMHCPVHASYCACTALCMQAAARGPRVEEMARGHEEAVRRAHGSEGDSGRVRDCGIQTACRDCGIQTTCFRPRMPQWPTAGGGAARRCSPTWWCSPVV